MGVTTTVKQAERRNQKAATGKTPAMDILDTLKQEHEDVAELLGKLVESKGAAQRRNLLSQIKDNLVPHVRAEEKVLYDAILALKSKTAQVDGAEGYIEHDLADKTMARMEKIADFASPEFTAAAKVLKELVEHHVEEEESNVWSDARKHFSAAIRKEMNARYLAQKQKVRVH